MCRSKSEGGRICPGAQKMNTARRQVSRLTAELSDDSLDEERRAKLTRKLHRDLHRLTDEAYEHSAIPVPEHLLKTGEEFNSAETAWAFCAPEGKDFNSDSVTPVVNREYARDVGYHYLDSVEGGWENYLEERDGGPHGKPAGGIWLSPVGDDGVTEWEHLIENAPEWDEGTQKWNRSGRYDATLSPDARVLYIDTLEDYYDAVDACHREVPDDFGGESAKGLDYSRLNVDAVYISQRASKGSAFSDDKREGYEQLGLWDVDSTIVLRPQSVEMSEAGAPRRSREELESLRQAHRDTVESTLRSSSLPNLSQRSREDDWDDAKVATLPHDYFDAPQESVGGTYRQRTANQDDGAWGGDDWKDDLDDFGDAKGNDDDDLSVDELMAKLGISGGDDSDEDDDYMSDDQRWD